MPKKPRLSVTSESGSGLNTRFRDNRTGREMTRGQVANEIERGNYSDYHIRRVNGRRIIASNPDGNTNNNLD